MRAATWSAFVPVQLWVSRATVGSTAAPRSRWRQRQSDGIPASQHRLSPTGQGKAGHKAAPRRTQASNQPLTALRSYSQPTRRASAGQLHHETSNSLQWCPVEPRSATRPATPRALVPQWPYPHSDSDCYCYRSLTLALVLLLLPLLPSSPFQATSRSPFPPPLPRTLAARPTPYCTRTAAIHAIHASKQASKHTIGTNKYLAQAKPLAAWLDPTLRFRKYNHVV